MNMCVTNFLPLVSQIIAFLNYILNLTNPFYVLHCGDTAYQSLSDIESELSKKMYL